MTDIRPITAVFTIDLFFTLIVTQQTSSAWSDCFS